MDYFIQLVFVVLVPPLSFLADRHGLECWSVLLSFFVSNKKNRCADETRSHQAFFWFGHFHTFRRTSKN